MGEGPLLAASLSGRGGEPRAPAAGWPWDGHTVPPGRQQGGPSPRARPGAQTRRRGRGSPLPWQSWWPQVGKKGLERRTRCSVTAGPGGSGRAGRVAENAGQPHGPREVGGHAFHEPGRRGRVVFPRRALLGACEHSVGAPVVGPRLSSARKTVERRDGGSDGGGWSQRQPTARGPGSSPAVKWRTVGEGAPGSKLDHGGSGPGADARDHSDGQWPGPAGRDRGREWRRVVRRTRSSHRQASTPAGFLREHLDRRGLSGAVLEEVSDH